MRPSRKVTNFSRTQTITIRGGSRTITSRPGGRRRRRTISLQGASRTASCARGEVSIVAHATTTRW
eukprot:7315236-Prymnesium_polylepis.2